MDEVVAGYRLVRLVGRGRDGEVWAAVPPGGGPLVAVKRAPVAAPPPVRSALRAEAEVLAALDHPGLVPLVSVVDDPPGVALVLPLLAGSLRHVLDRTGSVGARAAAGVLVAVADALAAAHRAGVVHGDVKPENLLVDEEGAVHLADLGVARLLGRPGPAVSAGTAGYLDPAVAVDAPPTTRSDAYALAVVGYELLAGTRPHLGSAVEAHAAAAGALHPRLASLPGVDPDLGAVVDRALAADPSARWPDLASFAAAVRRAAPPEPLGWTPPAVTPAEPAGARRTRAVAAAGGPEAEGLPADRSRRRWRLAVAVGAAAGLALVAAMGVRAGRSRTAAGRPRAEAAVAGTTEETRPVGPAVAVVAPARRPSLDPTGRGPCPRSTPPGTTADGDVRAADLDGDGCAEALRWDGRVLLAPSPGGPIRYRIAVDHEVLVLGRWSCGAATPALYRASDGRVRWVGPLDLAVGERRSAVRSSWLPAGGTPVVGHGADGCDRVVVVPG